MMRIPGTLLTLLALGAVLPLRARAEATERLHTLQQPPSLTVRNGDKVNTVPLASHPDGGLAIRLDLVASALGGEFSSRGSAVEFTAMSTTFGLTNHGTLVVVGTDTIPLAARVFVNGGQVYGPLSFVTEVIPRAGNGIIYDIERKELRRFTVVTQARNATPQVQSSRASPPPRAPVTRNAESRRRVVVVDAGHGGVDPGMSARPDGLLVREKNITLAVARELKAALERRGVSVVMTRTTDTLIALADRGHIANSANGDLFISVHVNAANPNWSRPSQARGFETYFLAEAQTEDERRVEAMENEAIKFETNVDPSRQDPLGFILRDMAQNEHLRESARLAELIQGGLKQVHPGTNRGVKQAAFRVLITAFMPAVLVEIGFGTNPSDARFMTSPESQRELANSIADAAVAYLSEYERKVNRGGAP